MTNLRNATHAGKPGSAIRGRLHTGSVITRGGKGLHRRSFGGIGKHYLEGTMGKVLHFRARGSGFGDFGGGCRGAFFPNQFRPDAVPVTRTEIPAANLPTRRPLDRNAVLWAGKPVLVPVLPLADLGRVLDVDGCGEGRDAHGALGIEVGEKVHAPIVVANATRMQAAFATPRVDTLKPMTTEDVTEHRRQRLLALVRERYGDNKSEFGKSLGLQDGALVRQWLSGHRPITEKTIARIEALPNLAGWFGAPVATEDGKPLVLTAEERDVILGMRAAKAARLGGSNVTPFPNDRRASSGATHISNPGASGKNQQRRSTDKKKGGE